MRTRICEEFGIEYPIFGFTPSEHVAAAVSRAGGMGVLGAVRFNDAADLATTLDWMDENVDGKPYGVDVVMPMQAPTEGAARDFQGMIPDEHRTWVEKKLQEFGVPPLPDDGERSDGVLGWLHSVAQSHVDVALKHPISLIANALGSPPKDVIDRAHEKGIKVAALAGKPKHAESHVANGVDVVVAQGHEAGGHTGEITTVVLVPEIVDAVGPDTMVLAAGGIGTGRQLAAALALGADGAWMGSLWLTTKENTLMGASATTQALLGATSSDTIRSRAFSGKPARLLKTKWIEAWEAEDSPGTLPMPLQGILVSEAHQRLSQMDDPELVAMPVGQIVGRMNEQEAVADVVARLVEEFEEAAGRIGEARSSS